MNDSSYFLFPNYDFTYIHIEKKESKLPVVSVKLSVYIYAEKKR